MPLHGNNDQLKMVRLFNKFLNDKKSKSSIYYTNKFSIYQIENKIKKYYDLICFLECDIKFYDLTYIEEDDYNFINDVNSLNQYDIFEKSEFLIPSVVSDLIKEGVESVDVLNSSEKWFGVTFPEDKKNVSETLFLS